MISIKIGKWLSALPNVAFVAVMALSAGSAFVSWELKDMVGLGMATYLAGLWGAIWFSQRTFGLLFKNQCEAGQLAIKFQKERNKERERGDIMAQEADDNMMAAYKLMDQVDELKVKYDELLKKTNSPA